MERGAFSELFQDTELPGSITFGSGRPLSPGSAVIVHSALLHGRRALPGGDDAKPRYFIDVSYCQPGLKRWPIYGGLENHRSINKLANSLGHHRNHRYDHLFDESMALFYDRNAADTPTEAHAYVRPLNRDI